VRFDSASNPVTLAQSGDILYLCLPGHAELKDLLLTKKVANALPAAGVVINHATGDPGAATQIGIGYLDAPVCVGRSAAV
jgi:3-hydroxyisobutyrate dehydrogenase-like beta-hydroxyacid dehydrogenase